MVDFRVYLTVSWIPLTGNVVIFTLSLLFRAQLSKPSWFALRILKMLQYRIYTGVIPRSYVFEHFVHELGRIASNLYFG